MTRYILTKPHFIDNQVKDAGTEIETDAPPSLGMEGVDDEGRKKCEARDEEMKKRRDQAVASGAVSKVMADNVIPKPEKPPPADEQEDSSHGRRPRR